MQFGITVGAQHLNFLGAGLQGIVPVGGFAGTAADDRLGEGQAQDPVGE